MSRVDRLIECANAGFGEDGNKTEDDVIACVIESLSKNTRTRELSRAITKLEEARLWLAAADCAE